MIDPLSLHLDLSVPNATPHSTVPKPIRRLLKPTATPHEYILELDYSTLSSYLECPRKFQNKSVYSREAERDAVATSTGKLFHQCEEVRLRLGYTEPMRQRQLELIQHHYMTHPVAVDEYRNAARMVQVTEQYNTLYANDLWPSKILVHEGEPFIERPFKIELCTVPVHAALPYDEPLLLAHSFESKRLYVSSLHVILTGRIDAILHDCNVLWVVDHKTTSRGGREYEEAFHLSLQTRGYAWAVRELGIPVVGLIMNGVILRKPTPTGKATEFIRNTHAYAPWSLDEFADSLRAHVSDLVHSLIRGYFPQSARSFKSPCAGCDYAQNCTLPPEQRAADLASPLYRDCTWDPMDND